MEKQYNVAIKDYLVAKIAKELDYPESLCDHVIMWAYKDAKLATLTKRSVELSGFGTLLVSSPKIKRRAPGLERKLLSAIERGNEKSAIATKNTLDFLYAKLTDDEMAANKGSQRGMEQPSVSAKGIEGADRTDIRGEAEYMQELPVQQHTGEN